VTTERRASPRTPITIECTLRRRSGSPIEAKTIDLGPGGMCVTCARPLSPDEVLSFEITQVSGRARVMRQQAARVYGLRFEQVPEQVRQALLRLAKVQPDHT
jgi:hypothetical protein